MLETPNPQATRRKFVVPGPLVAAAVQIGTVTQAFLVPMIPVAQVLTTFGPITSLCA